MENKEFYTKKYKTKSGQIKTYSYAYNYKPTERGERLRAIREVINELLENNKDIFKDMKRSEIIRAIHNELIRLKVNVTIEYVTNYLRKLLGNVKPILK